MHSLAIMEQYAIDYQKNAFGVNAPTDVVRRITGREAEDFETIARRCNPQESSRQDCGVKSSIEHRFTVSPETGVPGTWLSR